MNAMNEINVYFVYEMNDMKCQECKKELKQTPGKRAKKFCSISCRSNYWQKQNRKKKSGLPLPKDYIDIKGNISAVNEAGTVVIKNVAAYAKIKALEAELPTIPENTVLGKRRIAWIKNEIYKLKKSN